MVDLGFDKGKTNKYCVNKKKRKRMPLAHKVGDYIYEIIWGEITERILE